MAGIERPPTSEPMGNEVASLLRHDLVTPINLIVGYCDLLISEAVESGLSWCVPSLRSIRSVGFILLKAIDQSLLIEQPGQPTADLGALARSLEDPAEVIVRACDALEVMIAGNEGSQWADFREDLSRIRSAGIRMISMAHTLAAGLIPDDGRSQIPDPT